MIRAILSWLCPPTVYEVTSTELVIALRRAGYTPSFRRLPAATVRALCKK